MIKDKKVKGFICVSFVISVVLIISFFIVETKYWSLLMAGVAGLVMSIYSYIKEQN